MKPPLEKSAVPHHHREEAVEDQQVLVVIEGPLNDEKLNQDDGSHQTEDFAKTMQALKDEQKIPLRRTATAPATTVDHSDRFYSNRDSVSGHMSVGSFISISEDEEADSSDDDYEVDDADKTLGSTDQKMVLEEYTSLEGDVKKKKEKKYRRRSSITGFVKRSKKGLEKISRRASMTGTPKKSRGSDATLNSKGSSHKKSKKKEKDPDPMPPTPLEFLLEEAKKEELRNQRRQSRRGSLPSDLSVDKDEGLDNNNNDEDKKIRRTQSLEVKEIPIDSDLLPTGVKSLGSFQQRKERSVMRKKSSSSSLNLVKGPHFRRTKSMAHSAIRAPSKATKTLVQGTVHAGEAVIRVSAKASHAVVDAGHAVVDAGAKASYAVVDAGAKASHAVVEGTTQVVVNGSNLVIGSSMAVVEGTTQVVVGGSRQVLKGGMAVAEGTFKGGMAVAEGTTQVFVGGGKHVLRGSTNIVRGSTLMVTGGGKMVLQGSKNAAKSLKRIASKGQNPFLPRQKRQKSKWEESVEVIDELLDPSSPTFEAMTSEQRQKLASVKKFLIKGPKGNFAAQHVPRDLIHIQTMPRDEDDEKDAYKYDKDGNPLYRRKSSMGMRRNSDFILQEYAGVHNKRTLLRELSEVLSYDGSDSEDEGPIVSGRTRTASTVSANESLKGEIEEATKNDNVSMRNVASLPFVEPEKFTVDEDFVPVEFTYMDYTIQKELCEMLSWDSLKSWDFDIFRLNEITNGQPLLFLGWAVLSSPFAQQAMARDIGVPVPDASQGYPFVQEISIPAEKLCNYLRAISNDYNSVNPYHNAIHAADVMQTMHSMIQQSLHEEFMKDIPKISLFAVLLSAAVHDVEHPGKTNAFHVKLRTELAVTYNDVSVLENHHLAHAFARMLDLDLNDANDKGMFDSEGIKKRRELKQDRISDNNILCNATDEQFETIRRLMIDAIMHTDMTKHFAMVNAARGILMENNNDGEEENDNDENDNIKAKKAEASWEILMYMLHLADISSQGKGPHLFIKWTKRVMDEFFLQGDLEQELGLDISPLCDRKTTSVPESQVGFIQYVVQPSFEVLSHCMSFINTTVLPLIRANLDHWFAEQEGLKLVAAAPEDTSSEEKAQDGSEELVESSETANHDSGGRDGSESYGSDYSY